MPKNVLLKKKKKTYEFAIICPLVSIEIVIKRQFVDSNFFLIVTILTKLWLHVLSSDDAYSSDEKQSKVFIFHAGVFDNYFSVKGLSSKPSGDCIVVPNFCFLCLRLQILSSCLFFYFV